MITKKLNFTVVTGKIIEQIRAPDGEPPFNPDFGLAHFIFTVPRKISFESAVREVKKKYPDNEIVKNSVSIEYEQHCYSISIEDFIQASRLIK